MILFLGILLLQHYTPPDIYTHARVHTHVHTKKHTHTYVCINIYAFLRNKTFDADGLDIQTDRQKDRKTDKQTCIHERWGAGVEYQSQEFNEPYAPS